MDPVSEVPQRIDSPDRVASAELLPLVYQELKSLAVARLAMERPGQTLSATALVHEAYLRVIGAEDSAKWSGRGHFFAAAAEAMRRILVENARRKNRIRHAGAMERVEMLDIDAPTMASADELLAVHEALDALAEHAPSVAELVKMHYFAGLTLRQCAEALGISERSAYRDWAYARAWLLRKLGGI